MRMAMKGPVRYLLSLPSHLLSVLPDHSHQLIATIRVEKNNRNDSSHNRDIRRLRLKRRSYEKYKNFSGSEDIWRAKSFIF